MMYWRFSVNAVYSGMAGSGRAQLRRLRTVVDFIYARFGVATMRSTPYVAGAAARARCLPCLDVK